MNLSERVLGRRVVNYLKNEALVGRINSQKIKVGLCYIAIWLDLTMFCDKEHLSKKVFIKLLSRKSFIHFLKIYIFLFASFSIVKTELIIKKANLKKNSSNY